MRWLLPLILLFALCAHGEGPEFEHKEPTTQLEFDNVYQDLRSVLRIPSRTLVQLQALTPSRAGLPYYCSNCTTDGLVVSTGTTRGAFGRVSARSTTIN